MGVLLVQLCVVECVGCGGGCGGGGGWLEVAGVLCEEAGLECSEVRVCSAESGKEGRDSGR